MFPTGGLPAIGRHINSKPEKVGATANGASLDGQTPERLSVIESWSEAGKKAMSLRKAKPAVLPASCSITGFRLDVAPAQGNCSTEPALCMQIWLGSRLSSACCTAHFFSSSDSEGSESSNTERPSAAVRHSLHDEDVKLKKMRDRLEEDGGKPFEGGIA